MVLSTKDGLHLKGTTNEYISKHDFARGRQRHMSKGRRRHQFLRDHRRHLKCLCQSHSAVPLQDQRRQRQVVSACQSTLPHRLSCSQIAGHPEMMSDTALPLHRHINQIRLTSTGHHQ